MAQSYYSKLTSKFTKQEEERKTKFWNTLPSKILWMDRLRNWEPSGWGYYTPVKKIKRWLEFQPINIDIVLKDDIPFVKTATIIFDEFFHEFNIDLDNVTFSEYQHALVARGDYFHLEVQRNETCEPIYEVEMVEQKTLKGYRC